MTEIEIATREVGRLAGRAGFRDRVRPGLTEMQIAESCRRVADARARASLTVRDFRALRGTALRQFCADHGVDRAEALLAQELAGVAWAAARACRLAAYIARARGRGVRSGGRLQ